MCQKLEAYFAQYKIPATDIEAHDIAKDIVRKTTENGKELEILGYEFTREFTIKLAQLDKFEILMKGLYGMENVSRLNAYFENSKQKEYEAELTEKACLEAKEEAERLAKGFGARLGPVYRISRESIRERSDFESFDNSGPTARDIAYAVDSDPIFYPPATIHMSQEVHAIFEVRP
jgi:uncharacterized protein YggE